MAGDTKERVSKKIQEIRDLVSEEIKSLESEKEKKYAQYLKNSHGVYRDEVKQFRMDIEMNSIQNFIDVMHRIRDYIGKPS